MIKRIHRKTKFFKVYDVGTNFRFYHEDKTYSNKNLRILLGIRDNVLGSSVREKDGMYLLK